MEVTKHAYLIMAHAHPYVLEKLIALLDDERNDIYIHIDKKIKDFDFPYFQKLAAKSRLIFSERIDIRWGHVSQIETELLLFKTAFSSGIYSYYHLLSGVDLPIKSQDYIHQFFEKNKGKEFIGFSSAGVDLEKVNKIHLFPKNMRVQANQPTKRLARKLREVFLSLQRLVGYDHTEKENLSFIHGANWVSITSQLVEDLVKREQWFLHFYKYSSCADEIYKQTYVYNSKYKDAVFDSHNELKGCMRFMDWQRGNPYTFRAEDLELILSSEMLFARKFEDVVDKEIIDQISRAKLK